jgi:hypothetical protein
VRSVAVLSVLILAAIWWACKIHGPSGSDAVTGNAPLAEGRWRRTADGWERATWLADAPRVRRRLPMSGPYLPRLHPAVVAGWMALVSVAVLATSSPPPTAQRPSQRLSATGHAAVARSALSGRREAAPPSLGGRHRLT